MVAPGSGSAARAPSVRRTGEIAADSEAQVRAALRRMGLTPVSLRPARSERGTRTARRTKGRPAFAVASAPDASSARASLEAWRCARARRRRRASVIEWCESLSALLTAGTELSAALDLLAPPPTSASRAGWRGLAALDRGRRGRATLCRAVAERVRSGVSLSESMAERPDWFGPVEVALVDAAERSGGLDHALLGLAEDLARADEVRGKIAGALAYPALLGLVGVGVAVFLSTVTLPQVAGVLSDSGVALPAPTRVLMAFGSGLSRGWFLALPMAAACVAGVGVLGARVYLSSTAVGVGHCRGWVWGENIGWISLSSANPAPQGPGAAINTLTVPHSNSNGLNFGVNIDPSGAYGALGGGSPGALFGFAWSENAGWLNFGTTPAVGASLGARIDVVSRRIRGWAWAENLGWINLDDVQHFVGALPSDANGDGVVNFADLNLVLGFFGQSVGSNPPGSGVFASDVTGDGVVDFRDLNLVLSNFGVGCA